MRWAKNLHAALQVVAAQPGRVLLLVLPVAISTALALATLAIDQGLSAKAEAAARSFGTDVISIRPGTRVMAGKSGSVNTLTDDDVQVLRSRLRSAKAIEGTRIEDSVPVSHSAKNGTYRIFAVRPPWAGIRQFGAERGEFLADVDVETSARVCIIGQTVARELFSGEEPLGAELLINQVPFQIKGVLVSKGASPAEGDRDARIVIPITTFYDRLYKRLHLDQIVVQANDASHETLASLDAQIRVILREQHHIGSGQADDFVVRVPEKIAEESRGLSRSVLLLLLGLAGVGAIVAALVIALVMQQAIKARQGEIGIRRAIGATPADILQQVAAEGLAVSILGGVVGMALGFAAAWGLAHLQQMAFAVNAAVIAGPLIFVLVAALAGLWPAFFAARLDPAVALRSTGR
jgi:putative ABC transport system permease protein